MNSPVPDPFPWQAVSGRGGFPSPYRRSSGTAVLAGAHLIHDLFRFLRGQMPFPGKAADFPENEVFQFDNSLIIRNHGILPVL